MSCFVSASFSPARRLLLPILLLPLLAACKPAEERAAAYLELAQTRYAEGDSERARLDVRNAIQIEPRNAEARYLLSQIEESDGNIQQMVQQLFVVVDVDPSHVEARIKLANLMFFGGVPEQSVEQVEVLHELAPDNPQVLILRGRHAELGGDADAALAAFERARTIAPDNAEAQLLYAVRYAGDDIEQALPLLEENIGRLPADDARPLREVRALIFAERGRYAELEAEYRALIEDYPDDARFQRELVRLLASQNRTDDADNVLRSLADRDQDNVSARLNYASFLYTMRDPADAEAALRAFREQNPERFEYSIALAELYERDERNDDARQLYESIALEAPRSPDGMLARNRLAVLDFQSGDIKAARERLESILADAPDDQLALRLRAGMHYAERRYGDAIADLRNSLRRDENSQPTLLLLARAYQANGERALAQESYRRLLTVRPDHAEALSELAMLLVGAGDLAGAQPLMAQLKENTPDDILASARYLEMLILRGDLDAAEEEARRLMTRENQEGIGEFQLGRVYQARGDLPGAIVLFEKALAYRPLDPRALETLVNARSAAGRNAENVSMLTAHRVKHPDQLQVELLLARALAAEGKLGQARKLLDGLVASRPEAPIAWIALAGIDDDRDQRIKILLKGMDALPGNPEIGAALGADLYAAARNDEAIAVYESVVAAAPQNQEAKNNLAVLLLDRPGDQAGIDRAFELVAGFAGSDNPALLDTLGWAHYRRGDYATAVSVLERAVARRGDVPILRYRLGMAYLAMGNKIGARQQLSTAVAGEGVRFNGIEEARAALRELGAG